MQEFRECRAPVLPAEAPRPPPPHPAMNGTVQRAAGGTDHTSLWMVDKWRARQSGRRVGSYCVLWPSSYNTDVFIIGKGEKEMGKENEGMGFP